MVSGPTQCYKCPHFLCFSPNLEVTVGRGGIWPAPQPKLNQHHIAGSEIVERRGFHQMSSKSRKQDLKSWSCCKVDLMKKVNWWSKSSDKESWWMKKVDCTRKLIDEGSWLTMKVVYQRKLIDLESQLMKKSIDVNSWLMITNCWWLN